jgi:hypothetical protein
MILEIKQVLTYTVVSYYLISHHYQASSYHQHELQKSCHFIFINRHLTLALSDSDLYTTYTAGRDPRHVENEGLHNNDDRHQDLLGLPLA